MSKESQSILVFLPFVAVLVCCFLYPEETIYTKEYIFLSVGLFTYLLVNMICFSVFNIYIFEPIVLIFILYLFVFFIDPIINIINGETSVMGFQVMDGCIRATIVFIFSYLSFLIGYYSTFKISKNRSVSYQMGDNRTSLGNWDIQKIERVATIIWLLSFSFGCIELLSKGMSVSYFLSLGLSGQIEDIAAESAFGFFGNFRFSMITAWVYLFACNNKSVKTRICGVLTLEYFVLRGFRHSLFVAIFAPIVYSFVKKRKSPKKSTVVLMLVVIVLIMGIMQFVRGSLRSGTAVDWSSFETDIFIDAIQGNCDVYKTFYGMVMVVPDSIDYQWGMCSIVSVITMIIPRAFWPGKPVSPIITNLGMFCGEMAAKSGYAMPNISEYYLDFGTTGCVVFLFILGKILQKMKLIAYSKILDRDMLILYSVIFPALLQVVLRGYSPSYIYLLFFYAFPVIVIRFFGGIKWIRK